MLAATIAFLAISQIAFLRSKKLAAHEEPFLRPIQIWPPKIAFLVIRTIFTPKVNFCYENKFPLAKSAFFEKLQDPG